MCVYVCVFTVVVAFMHRDVINTTNELRVHISWHKLFASRCVINTTNELCVCVITLCARSHLRSCISGCLHLQLSPKQQSAALSLFEDTTTTMLLPPLFNMKQVVVDVDESFVKTISTHIHTHRYNTPKTFSYTHTHTH